MINKVMTGLWGVVALLAASVAMAADMESRSFTVPGHGELELTVPTSWQASVEPSGYVDVPTVVLEPGEGKRFTILITVLYVPEGEKAAPGLDTLQAIVTQSSQEVAPQSVEGTLPLVALEHNGETVGYYFTATDPAPEADGFKYMTQGMLKLGGLLPTFTLLSNEADGEERAMVLQMMAGARHIQ